MASEIERFVSTRILPDARCWNSSGAAHTYVRATDHDRVVAELRSHVRTDNSAVIAGLQGQMAEARELLRDAKVTAQVHMSCQVGVIPRCRCQSCVHARIDAWLEKTK